MIFTGETSQEPVLAKADLRKYLPATFDSGQPVRRCQACFEMGSGAIVQCVGALRHIGDMHGAQNATWVPKKSYRWPEDMAWGPPRPKGKTRAAMEVFG